MELILIKSPWSDVCNTVLCLITSLGLRVDTNVRQSSCADMQPGGPFYQIQCDEFAGVK